MDLVRLGSVELPPVEPDFLAAHPTQDQLITPPRGRAPDVEHLALTETMTFTPFGALMETSEGQTRFSSRERSPGVLQLHVCAVPASPRDAFGTQCQECVWTLKAAGTIDGAASQGQSRRITSLLQIPQRNRRSPRLTFRTSASDSVI